MQTPAPEILEVREPVYIDPNDLPKWWRTKQGEAVKIKCILPWDDPYPVIGEYKGQDLRWTAAGYYFEKTASGCDLSHPIEFAATKTGRCN